MNNSSVIVGGFSDAQLTPIAAMWSSQADIPVSLLGMPYSYALAINDDGLVTGAFGGGVFLWSPSLGMTDVGLCPGLANSGGRAINKAGEIAGWGNGTIGCCSDRAFFWSPVSGFHRIDPPAPYFGSVAYDINNKGQVAGIFDGLHPPPAYTVTPYVWDSRTGNLHIIDSIPVVDPAVKINDMGWLVGTADFSGFLEGFLYVDGQTYKLSDLTGGWLITQAVDINSTGQILGYGTKDGFSGVVLLTPITPYKAVVQPPLNADGSSIFKANRGVIPVKFNLTKNDAPTCDLPPATIAVTRTAGATLGAIDESTYSNPADNGSNFRIDPTACQYIYNLAANSLGVGTYRGDILISGNVVGSAVFALK